MRFILFKILFLIILYSIFADSIQNKVDSVPEPNLLSDSSYANTDTSEVSDSIIQIPDSTSAKSETVP